MPLVPYRHAIVISFAAEARRATMTNSTTQTAPRRIRRWSECSAARRPRNSFRTVTGGLALQRAEDLLDDAGPGAHRVLADLLLLLGHHQEEAVERLLRHVLVQV